MKKVLIISTHFAPDIHVGAKRITKFSRYLPEYGWQPVILTKEVQYYHGIDETMNEDLPPDMPIYRVRERHLFGAKGPSCKDSLKDVSGVGLSNPANRRWMSHLTALLDGIFFYDYSWLVPAFFTGLRLLRQQKINLIFSTSPNPEAHLVGLLLKVLTGVKWVCEFRDPWRDPFLFPAKTVIQDVADSCLLKSVLHNADYIIAVGQILGASLAKDSGDSCEGKIGVIYNGYDREDFIGLDPWCQEDRFVITYAGTWGHYRTPEYFLRAIGRLLREREELRGRIRVEFIGEVRFTPGMESKIRQVIEQENLAEIMYITPFLPHRKALSKIFNSHVLLLVEGSVPGKPVVPRGDVVTAKLFEYLYAQRPILALVPPEGEAARIIKEAAAGEIVAPYDLQGIKNKVYEMYQSFQRGELGAHARVSEIEKFDRRNQTATLVRIFDSLL